MIDANVFVLVFFLYNSRRFLPQTQLKGTRMFQTFRGSPALSEFRIQGLKMCIRDRFCLHCFPNTFRGLGLRHLVGRWYCSDRYCGIFRIWSEN